MTNQIDATKLVNVYIMLSCCIIHHLTRSSLPQCLIYPQEVGPGSEKIRIHFDLGQCFFTFRHLPPFDTTPHDRGTQGNIQWPYD